MVLYQLIVASSDDPMQKQKAPQLVHVKRLGRLRGLYYRLRGWWLARFTRKHHPPIEALDVPGHLDTFDVAIEVPDGLSEKLVYDLIGIHNKSSVKVVVCLPKHQRGNRSAVEV